MAEAFEILSTSPRVERVPSGIDDGARKEIAADLGGILGATYSLLIKTHVHHWNVVGPLFHPLHIMLEEQYQALFQSTDLFAERIRALGFPAPIPAIAVQPEARTMSAEEIVVDLVADHAAAVRRMREVALKADSLEDIVSHDMLVARMTWHEKTMWMLGAVISK
jgi:starvation-inducible DNA-binding protein